MMETDPRLEDSLGVPVSSRERDFIKNVSIWRQSRALFLKDLTLQFRAVGTNICQLLTPIIFILFVGIMQVIVNFILRDHHYPVPGTESATLPPVNPGRLVDCSYLNTTGLAPHIPKRCRENTLNFFDEFPQWRDLLREADNNSFINHTLLDIVNFTLTNMSEHYPNCQKALFDFPLYYVGTGDGVDFDLVGNLSSSDKEPDYVSRSGLVGGMVPDKWLYSFSLDFRAIYNDSNVYNLTCPANIEKKKIEHGSVQVPLFLREDNQTSFRNRLIEVVKEYNLNAHKSSSGNDQYNRNYDVSPLSGTQYDVVMGYIKNQTWSKVRPHAGIFIDKFTTSAEEVTLNYTMVANDLVLTKYHPKNGTGIPMDLHNLTKSLKSISLEIHRRNGIVNMMSNALYKKLAENKTGAEDVVIATYIMPMPSKGMNITIDITTLIGGVLFPFAFSFLIPVFMSSLVKDKFEKHLIMMEQNGLSRWTYWLVTYTFNYLLYIPIAVEISILSYLFKMRLFTQTNYGVLVLTFFLWGHAEVVLGFFLSNFFSRPRTATIIGYLLVISGIVVALILEGLQVLPQDKTPFFLYMLWPPFAFYRLLQYFNLACLSMQCYGLDILSPSGGLNLVTTAMLYLGGTTIALMLVSVYLSFVLPSEYGVRKNPFFPIIAVFKGLKYLLSKAGLGKQAWKRSKTELETPPPEVRVDVDMAVDEDVKAEENSLRDCFPEDAPVVMYQLRKEYPGSGGNPPHVAVETISLAIQRNECFGLLGPNGAGKTTLISVLTGLYEPTSGVGRIAGYDISTDIQKIHHHLGVCPQFDIQHADLTAKEHLLFYARLKGVKWRREKEVVNRALKQVNLYEARNRKSKALSGGMRRRLSVAMACIGSPDILILDEPTTGLDPASRRQVWEVIENVKKGRSMILTTHAMEEADHLCTRIGIMNFGRLRCLGTQNRLKAKFGTGYQLAFNCAPGRVTDVEKFVRNNLQKAVHIETYADSCNYKLEKENLCVSELFETLDSVKVEIGILDWGIKMTTLEDVFLNIVKHSQDQRSKMSSSICPGWLPCQQCCPRRKQLDE